MCICGPSLINEGLGFGVWAMAAGFLKNSKTWSAGYLLLGLLVASGVAYIYSFYVFGASAEGNASSAGEITGSFLLIFVIGFFANGRKLTAKLFSVCLIIASGVFLVSNFSRLQEAIEVSHGHELLAKAKSYDEVLAISSQHPENKLLRFLGTVIRFRMSSQKTFAETFTPARINSSRCPTLVTSLDKQTYDDCVAFYASRLSMQIEIRDELPKLLADQESHAKLMLDKLERDDAWVDPTFVRSARVGLYSGFERSEKSTYGLVDELIGTTKGLQSLFEFLSQNVQSARVQNGRLVFTMAETANTYNHLIAEIERAEDAYLNQTRAVQKDDQVRLNTLTQ